MFNEILNLEGVTLLSKKQKQLVTGGVIPPGTCAIQGGNGFVGVSGVSKEYALQHSTANGGHWCCDSCQSATWLPQDHKDYLATLQ